MIIQCMTPCVCVYAQKTCSFVYCEHWIGQREETSSTFLELGQSIEIDRQKDRHIYRQTDRHKHRSTERQIERQKDRQIDRQTDRQIDRQTDRSIDRQTDRQIGRQTNRQIDRETDRQIEGIPVQLLYYQKLQVFSSCWSCSTIIFTPYFSLQNSLNYSGGGREGKDRGREAGGGQYKKDERV